MIRALAWIGVLGFAAVAQESAVDPVKLQKVRNLSPEERAKLMARLEELKKLSPVERQRLQQNLSKIKALPAEEVRKLREKATQLSGEEKKEYAELASGFFKWTRREVRKDFPRGLFFTWVKREHPAEMQRIRDMDPPARVDAFVKLYTEFRNDALTRAEQHAARHKCVSPEEIRELRDSAPEEIWPRFHEFTRACTSKNPRPGPVPPRPLEPEKK